MIDVTALLERPTKARVVRTVLDKNPGMDAGMAERIVDEAVKFTAACAAFPEEGLRPSRMVDEGWHALILHTRVYSELCDRIGRFVHHVPEQPETDHPSAEDQNQDRDRTQELMAKAGYAPDPALWCHETSAQCCSDCEKQCCSSCGPNGSTTERAGSPLALAGSSSA